MPPKPDLSYTGLDEIAIKPVVENKSSEEETKAVRKNPDAPIVEEWVSDDEEDNVTQPKIVKKTVRPIIVKKEFVKHRQQKKTARKTVKKTMKKLIDDMLLLEETSKEGKSQEKVFFLATKDETSGILKSFITRIENLVDHKVKVIRCDNATELKNRELNQFCEMKGILRQFSVARTPQQNEVAERRNKTLIKAARTMLADSKLPTTFWTEVVNTACYVQNRVLVVKPHNKTLYEFFHGRTPTLSFMRQFGCSVTIINTKYHLGKFAGKDDEGFFVRYSLNSKAFRVFNSRTRIVEENLHIRFSKNTSNVVGSGPDWLFDIDTLTRTMNYEPGVAGTQSNDYVDPKSSHNDGFKPSSDDGKKVDQDPSKGNECNDQEKEDNVNNTNNVNTVSPTVIAAGTNNDNDLPFDPNMLALEDVGTFNFSNKDEDDGEMAYMNNLDTTIQVSPTLNVKSAFLNGKIEEEVYVCQPPGFEDLDFSDRVYKVEKALYGLHQAPRAWYETLSTYLLDNGFKSGKTDKTLFIKRFTEVKNASTPMETQKSLLKDEDREEVDVHVYRYLKGQPKLGLWYPKDSPFDLVTYTDSDYAGASLDRNSTTGGCQFIGCRLISWQCKKQTMVANSTTEAEYKHKKPKRKNTQVPQPSGSTKHVAGDAIHKERGNRLVRAATTTSSLEAEQDSGKIDKTQSKETPNEASSAGTTSGGGPRCQEAMEDTIAQTRKLNALMELCTNLRSRVLALEKTMTTHALEITSLKRRVKKLEKKQRIEAIDADEDITLVNDQDAEMFDVSDLQGEEVFVENELADKEVNDSVQKVIEEVVEDINTAKLIVNVAPVSAAGEINAANIATTENVVATITTKEVTLAKALAEFKASKPKVKWCFIQEPSKSITTTTTISSKKSQDKGKCIMVEEHVKPKKKEKIRLDEEAALKLQAELQAEFEEEQRLAREKGKKLKDLKNKSFDSIKKMFDIAFKRVNTFVDFRTELVEGSSKRAGEELTQGSLKKQKVDDNKETTKLKELMKIIPDEEEVAIDAIPFTIKSLKIIDWKIHKEGKKSYYQVIRDDVNSKMYMVFNRMLKEFDREDLKDLYNLVKAKYRSTRPVKDLDLLLWGDLKTMFEPHVEDQVWKKQHGYKVLE
uniref:Ribonuclease H-like domain-containing protein n=1 Tax=Tanacetum cinerariifolium TaxID=118510 RepID=A0A699GXF6_TANCI|nr:ribonuclease H-like domain-containing protein [Tanacetum cinerariifolium]